METRTHRKEIVFENIFTHEQYHCQDPRDLAIIDGIEYVRVHRFGHERTFLMRRDSLQKVKMQK